ncbi:hypothetical protein ALC57_05345 [Trachymyrmex cornetzi]|uniref:MADF domain-containing protein n=1 Tax=Trachymyrmex cornetzi TaxID=471704 RepID=A0A151JAZ8_9HYME|nr:hypothetical protein ALC57_05345 [Trachymyrmex cornetzi]
MDVNEIDSDVENEGEIIKDNSSEEFVTVDEIYSVDDKIQDDLDLIALVEVNPRLYAKGKASYKNILEKDMAWVSIGKALKRQINGSEAKHRWDILRNLNGRTRQEILTLMEQQGRSGSGRENISYENLFSPQDNETTDNQTSLRSLKIPVSHIKKEKTDLEIESTFQKYLNDKESTDSQASSFKVPISDMKKGRRQILR